MKKIVSSFYWLLLPLFMYSQGLYNNGQYLIVPSGNDLRTSNLTIGSSGSLSAPGNVYISGNWTNNKGSTLALSSGLVSFNGSSTQQISGNSLTEFYNVTIESGAKVEIPAGKIFKVSNTLTNSNNTYDNLVLKSDASGTAYLINATSSVKGTQELFLTYDKYHYYSSSISNVSFPFGNQSDYMNTYTWNESTRQWDRQLNSLTNAKGYTVFPVNSDKTLSTTGVFNASTTTVAVSHTDYTNTGSRDYDEAWNLVGNPFPCAISISSFLSGNSSLIDGTVYIFDYYNTSSAGNGYSNQDYFVVNLSGAVSTRAHSNLTIEYVAPGQGFFVRAINQTSGNLSFTHAMKSINTATFFVPPVSDDKKLFLGVRDEKGNYNKILINIRADASTGFDQFYDSYKLQGNPYLSFYSLIAGEKEGLAIQSIPYDLQGSCIPLGLFAGNGGKYTFETDTIENFGSDEKIYFEDRLLKKVVDLTASPQYVVDLPKGEHKDRFFLCFNAYNTTGENEKKELFLNASGGKIYIFHAAGGKAEVLISDMLGKQLFHSTFSGEYYSFPFEAAKGYYLLTVLTEKESLTKKIFVQ